MLHCQVELLFQAEFQVRTNNIKRFFRQKLFNHLLLAVNPTEGLNIIIALLNKILSCLGLPLIPPDAITLPGLPISDITIPNVSILPGVTLPGGEVTVNGEATVNQGVSVHAGVTLPGGNPLPEVTLPGGSVIPENLLSMIIDLVNQILVLIGLPPIQPLPITGAPLPGVPLRAKRSEMGY